MSAPKHTPSRYQEPWTPLSEYPDDPYWRGCQLVFPSGARIILRMPVAPYGERKHVATPKDLVNRIAACVNGCAGMDPAGVAGVVEACKHYLNQYDSVHHGEDKGETPRLIRAAIASLEDKP